MTERQKRILQAIVEQYSEVAEPVGSLILAKLFEVSSATIRNDMVELENLGLIEQPHTSAGRIPTDKGYRTYVNQLIEAQKNEIHPARSHHRARQAFAKQLQATCGVPSKLVRRAVRGLAEMTDNLGFATIGEEIYISGFTNLFNQPDFANHDNVLALSRLIDNLEPWLDEVQPDEVINVFIGSENPIGKSSGATLIVNRFSSPYSEHSYIGVIGPTRQSYAKVMRLVEQTGLMLQEILSEA